MRSRECQIRRIVMKVGNIFEQVPEELFEEQFELLSEGGEVRVERIVSKGHSSPESGWYAQSQHEWVIVLRGEAIVLFEDNWEVHLVVGSYIDIPAHTKHKVKWTAPEKETIWLAVHY